MVQRIANVNSAVIICHQKLSNPIVTLKIKKLLLLPYPYGNVCCLW